MNLSVSERQNETCELWVVARNEAPLANDEVHLGLSQRRAVKRLQVLVEIDIELVFLLEQPHL